MTANLTYTADGQPPASPHAFEPAQRAGVYRAIAERRDMRHFCGGQVAPELLQRLLLAAPVADPIRQARRRDRWLAARANTIS